MSNIVYGMIEDQSGFIWIATDQGVSRFDGKNFLNYTAQQGLNDNDIFGIFEDSDGRIWFFPFNTDPCYYYKGKIFNSESDPRIIKNENPNHSVISYSLDQIDKKIMFLEGNCVENAKMVDFLHPENYYFVGELYASNSILYHFYVNNEMYVCSESGKTIYKVTNHRLIEWFSSDDLLGAKYMLNNNQLAVFTNGRTIKRYSFDHTGIHFNGSQNLENTYKSLYYKNNGNEIYGLESNKGFFLINNGEEVQLDLLSSKGPFWGGIIDSQSNIWYFNNNSGVHMFPKNKFIIYNVQHSPKLLEDRCISIAEYNQKIYIGHETKGVSEFYNGVFKSIIPINKKLTDGRILKIDNFENGIVAGGDQNLYRIKLPSLEIENFNPKTVSIKDIMVENDSVFVASHIGILNIDLNDKTSKRITTERSTCCLPLDNGKMIVGTLKGIFLSQNGQYKRLIDDPLLNKARISDIYSDKNGYVWVATYSHGLFIVKNNEYVHLSEFSPKNDFLFLSS